MKYLVVQAYWYFDQITGEYRYRIGDPGDALGSHPDFNVVNIHVFHPLFPQLAMTSDLLVLHLMPDEEMFQIIQLRKKMGKPTVFEIADNFLSLGPWVPNNDAYRNPLIRQNFLYFASICDGLQFSTHEVALKFGFLNPVHTVLENQIGSFSKSLPPDRPFVFGWGGSKGHEADLAEIAPVILDFCKRHKDAVFSYMGYTPIFTKYFSSIPAAQCRCIEAGPIEAYFQFLDSLHVGLAPLQNTDFNRCRSDVKFIEYAAHSVVPVLADSPPYRVHGRDGENALMFKDHASLDAALESLYQDPQHMRDLAARAYRFTSVKRDISDHIGRRVAFYRSLLKHEAFLAESPALPDCKGLIAYLRQATDAYCSENFPESLRLLNKVLQLHPGYHQAHIWKAKTQVKLGQFQELLDTYGLYKCDPIYFDLLLECLTIAAQELGHGQWREIQNHIANPVLKMKLEPVDPASLEQHYEQILAVNPYDYQTLQNLAVLLLKKGDPKGQNLLERALFIAPENSQLQDLATGS